MIAQLVLLATPFVMPPPPAELALEAAIACFEVVDYDCVEVRLQEALRGPLTRASEVQARLYEAQLALARRDELRARVALSALLALSPDYVPEPRLPPRLRVLIEEQRPPPPPFAAPFLRLDASTLRLFGRDGERWSEGLGVEATGGVVFLGSHAVGLSFSYSDHNPRTFELVNLTLMSLVAEYQLRTKAAFVELGFGAAAGGAQVEAVGATGTDVYYCLLVQAPLEVALGLYGGLSLDVRVVPSILSVEEEDRAAFSFLLPLTLGVRYGF